MFIHNCFLLIFLLSLLQTIKCNKFDDKTEEELRDVSTNLAACADYFHYKRTDDFINGNLTLPNLKIGDTIKLTLAGLRLKSSLDYKGLFLPDGNPQEIINKMQMRQPISYRVDFQVNVRDVAVPRLLKIYLNDNELCATKFYVTIRVNGETEQEIMLEHTLEIINDTLPVYTYNKHIPHFVENSTVEPTITGSIKDICGRTVTATHSEHPWLAAVYEKQLTGVKFLCTGALVSSQMVLSTYRCMKEWFTSSPDYFRIYLGRHDLNNIAENGVQTRDVKAVIYPQGNMFNNKIFLFQMKAPVVFTEYVTPICLWNIPANPTEIFSRWATCTGWDYYKINALPSQEFAEPVVDKVELLDKPACEDMTGGAKSVSQFLCVNVIDYLNHKEILILKENGTWFLRGVKPDMLYTDIGIHPYHNWIENEIYKSEYHNNNNNVKEIGN